MIAPAGDPNQMLLEKATRKLTHYNDPREKKNLEITINELRSVRGDGFHNFLNSTYKKIPPADNIIDLMNLLHFHNKVEKLPRFAKKNICILKVAMQKQWEILKDIFPNRVFFINMKKLKINPCSKPIEQSERNDIYHQACNNLLAKINPESVAIKIVQSEQEQVSYITLFCNENWAGIIIYSRKGAKNKKLREYFIEWQKPQTGMEIEEPKNFEINESQQTINPAFENQNFFEIQNDNDFDNFITFDDFIFDMDPVL